ncbi:myosin-like protein NUF2 [Scheffersomyces amazonensis]|uniref:myosin-like protein NUF2 n=1 Tax=Scheffersomyces amazonensis TaxID=1078765 RepID=UPI00315C62C5
MSRRSTIYRTGISTNRRINQVTSQQDAFPILDAKEITICLQSCDFIATEELVTKPTSLFIKSLFEQFLDTFMGLSPETIEKKVRSLDKTDSIVDKSNGNGNGNGNVSNGNSNGKHIEDQDQELENNANNAEEQIEDRDTSSALHLIVLHRAAFKFLQGCGIYDLTLMDIIRPDPSKIRRILSAVVNFARFREMHSQECEKLVLESESSLENVRKVQGENDKIINQIQGIKRKIEQDATEPEKKATLSQVNLFNSKLELELKKLKKQQEIVTLEHKQYKDEKSRLIEKLDDVQYLYFESSKELEKFKAYSETDLSVVNKIINDLKIQLQDLQNTYNDYDRRDQNLSITIDSIQLVEGELKNLFRILEEISNDISKERTSLTRLTESQEYLEQLKLQSNDLSRQIHQVERQLTNMQEKTDKLKVQADERITKSQQQLAKYREDYTKLIEQRNLKETEYNEKKELISEIENNINKRKTEHQLEIRNTELKVSRLNAQIKLYLDEVGKKVLT